MALNPAAIAEYLSDAVLPGNIKAQDWDAFHDLICIDEIARCGYLGVIWALGCGDSIGCPPVVNFGTEKQKQQFLPSVISGESRFCLGVTEPDGMFTLPISYFILSDRPQRVRMLRASPPLQSAEAMSTS